MQFSLTLPRLQPYLRKRIPGVAKKVQRRSIKCKRRSSGEARDRCSIIPTPPHPTPPPLLKIQWRSIKCKRRSHGVAEKIKWRSIKCKRRSSGVASNAREDQVAKQEAVVVSSPPHPTQPHPPFGRAR